MSFFSINLYKEYVKFLTINLKLKKRLKKLRLVLNIKNYRKFWKTVYYITYA